jgi:hypothetical protein
VETKFPCIIDHGKKTGKSVPETYKENKEFFAIVEENKPLQENELGIVRK